MKKDDVFTATTQKTNKDFVSDMRQAAQKYGFIIHNEEKMELANTFVAATGSRSPRNLIST